LTARFRLLLYRVGDSVMHLCPICNRRTRNFYMMMMMMMMMGRRRERWG